jgi:hypothetical protein
VSAWKPGLPLLVCGYTDELDSGNMMWSPTQNDE